MKPGQGWPITIVGMLLMNMAIVGVTLYYATSTRTSDAVPDYYAKALHWDDTARQRSANAAMGWTAAVTIRPRAGGSIVRMHLTDGAGAPIRTAKIELEMFHQGDPRVKFPVVMAAQGDGWFEGTLGSERFGRWHVHAVIEAVGMRYTTEQVIDSE